MNTQKLREALVELKHQRALLDTAISNFEEILSTLDGVAPQAITKRDDRNKESYIDLAVRILEEVGKPMHIVEIAKRVSQIRGKTVPRPSVESSLLRHMQIRGVSSRVVKVRPAFFGLPIWKTFTKEASNLVFKLAEPVAK